MTTGTLMKVKRNILKYFWPALSDNRSWKTFFGLFYTGFTVVDDLYMYQLLDLQPYKIAAPAHLTLSWVKVQNFQNPEL